MLAVKASTSIFLWFARELTITSATLHKKVGTHGQLIPEFPMLFSRTEFD
jgi:hypothetical protein